MSGVVDVATKYRTERRRPRLADLAARQHGVVSLRQLLALGLSASAVRSRVLAGTLHRVYRGVYAVGHPLLSAKGRYLAAVLACGEGAVLSHRSAANLLGLRSSSRERIEVLVEGSAPRQKPGIQVHRTAQLPAEDIVKRDGIPCTSVARTLLDLAEVVNARQLARAVDEAERLRLFDRTAVDHALERTKGRKGASLLLAAVQTYEDTGTRSELERRFAELCRQAGLPRPQANVLVEGLEVDFAWPDRRLIVETDGHAYHHTRRAFEEDRRRDQLLAAKGWRVVRFTWRQVAGEAERVEQTLRALAA